MFLVFYRDGAANEELIDFFSHVLGVKSRNIALDVGKKSRNKTLLINVDDGNKTAKTAEQIFHLLKNDMDS